MQLGAFSVSLTVKDIEASWRRWGAELADPEERHCVIGLLQGMLQKNMLTFNPGGTAMRRSSAYSPTFANCSIN